jgi:hypothetical protein
VGGFDWPPETALYLIWKDPWMTVASDTYIAATLATVGWQVPHTGGGRAGAARYPRLDDLAAEAMRADRLLLATEPYRFRESHAQELRRRLGGKAVDLIDGEWTSWYGSRAIAGLAKLAQFRRRCLSR